MALQRVRRRLWRRMLWILALVGAVATGASFHVSRAHRERIHTLQDVPEAPIAVVFGAGLASIGVPSKLLAERLDTGMALYRAGKVKKLLLSGDNSDRYHNETGAMKRYVVERGIPAADILADAAGLSTYDSCWRAREVFDVRKAILVTQRFHLSRALYLGNAFGIEAYGVPADGEGRALTARLHVREMLSRALAMAMVWLVPRPAPQAAAGG
jgi:vancomycin permeability regulator SanA